MYLSEQFLDKVGNDFSKPSIRQAVWICSREFLNRYGETDWKSHIRTLFFEEKEEGFFPKTQFFELMDFWEVFREFSAEFTDGEEVPEILLAVRKAEQMYQSLLNEDIMGRIGEHRRQRLGKLWEAVRNEGDKTVRIFKQVPRGFKLVYEMAEDWDSTGEDYKTVMENRLAEAMETGGLVLTFDRKKTYSETRQEKEKQAEERKMTDTKGNAGSVKGYLLENGDWSLCTQELLLLMKEELFKENRMAAIRGEMKGIFQEEKAAEKEKTGGPEK